MLNDAGQIAFRADLTGSGVGTTNYEGIWSGASGNLALVARSGSQAPGTPSGVTFGPDNYSGFTFDINSPVLNNAGQTAFRVTLTSSGGTTSEGQGIWSGASGNLTLVTRTGSQAPGTSNGVDFNTFVYAPVLNDAGQTAFVANLVGSGVDSTNEYGIWSEGSGALQLVAREGSQAPGTPSGVNFDRLWFGAPQLNNAGQIAFLASLIGSGVGDSNDRGIWASDRMGALQLIVREGDVLEVAPGDFRTISFLGFVGHSGIVDVRPSGFNNSGQLAFEANFTDGSRGIFVSNGVAIPEPSTFLLAAAALGLCLAQRRRRNRRSMPMNCDSLATATRVANG
jgi:hypothetical protein